MATLITLSGGNFAANAIGYVPPVIAGLQTWAYFGNASGDNTNLASGGLALTNVGTGPAYNPGYGRFTAATAALDTNIVDGPSMLPCTTVIAARSVAGAAGYPYGTFISGKGFDCWLNATTLHHFGVGPSQIDMPVNGNVWRLYAVNLAPVGQKSVTYDLTGGTSQVATLTSTAYTPNTGAHLLIGSDNAATGSLIDLAFFAFYSGMLSQAQLNSLIPSIRSTLATRGITV
jgi:hypothetical protein